MKTLSIFLLFFLAACKLFAADIKLTGATVILQDKNTGRPISGVYIYRTASSTYQTFSRLIGSFIEGPESRHHIVDYAITDGKGVATFPQVKIKNKKFLENIFGMNFYMNVMISQEYNSAGMDGFVKTCFSGFEPEKAKIISGDGIHDAVMVGINTYKFSWDDSNESIQYKIIDNKNHKYGPGMFEYISKGFVFDFNKNPLPSITVKLGKSDLDKSIINTEVLLGDGKKEPNGNQAGDK